MLIPDSDLTVLNNIDFVRHLKPRHIFWDSISSGSEIVEVVVQHRQRTVGVYYSLTEADALEQGKITER